MVSSSSCVSIPVKRDSIPVALSVRVAQATRTTLKVAVFVSELAVFALSAGVRVAAFFILSSRAPVAIPLSRFFLDLVRRARSAAVRSDTFVGSASHAGGGGILSNGAVEALHCSRTVGVLACGTLGAGSERGSRRLSEAAVDAELSRGRG